MKTRGFLFTTALLALASALLAVALYRVIHYMQVAKVYDEPCKSADLMMLVGGLVLIFILVHRLVGIMAVHGLLLIGGTCFLAIPSYFSPTDECCHFAYIEHVVSRHRLPTVRDPMSNTVFSLEEHIYPKPSTRDQSKRGLAGYIYQAVHPPLYYLVAGAVCMITPSDWIARIFILRGLGLLALMTSVLIMTRSYWNTVLHKIVPEDRFLFFSILCIFVLTPGILRRMTTISNLHLALPLCALFYHQLFRQECLSTEMTAPRAAMLGVLTGCILATHFFNITLIAVGVLFLLLHGKRRLAPVYLACSAAMVLPWLVFNYLRYGSLTGWKTVAPMMLGVVNPTNAQYDGSRVLQQLDTKFFHMFWNPEEIKQSLFLSDMTGKYLSGLVTVAVLACLIHQIRKLVAKDFSQRLDLLCLLGIGLNFGLLVYVSVSESVPTVLGRYMYFSLWPLIFLTYRFLVAMPVFERRCFAFSLIVSAAMLWTNFFVLIMRNQLIPLPH